MNMEWHFGSDIDDLAVPKDEQAFSWFPSPDSWTSWGKIFGNFDSLEKLTVSGAEEFLQPGIGFSSEVELITTTDVDQDSRDAFHNWNTYPPEQLDPQLNDIGSINEADDIFFRSLFEDATDVNGSESKDNLVSVNLSGDWNHVQECTYNNVESFSPPEKFEEPRFGVHVAEEHANKCDDISKNISIEESALVKLQRSTFQLTKKTRLCFRDSLYRLAENSRHHTKYSKDGKEAVKNCKPASKRASSRLQRSKAQGPENNAIDRIVATLLFNAPTSSTPYKEMPLRETYQANSDSYKSTSSISRLCDIPGHDAEVPTFGQTLPLLRCHQTCSSTTYSMQA